MAVIYAIPGLGCSKWIYQNIRVNGHTIKILNWPKSNKNFTLKYYAKEFLKQIDQTGEFYLMGVSFGGMLCIELGDLIEPEKIILISSAKNRNELPRSCRFLKYFPVHLLIPEKAFRKIALLSRKFLGFPKSLLPEFDLMIKSMPQNHFSHSINYIICWDRKANSMPVVHIHGDRDMILKYKNITNVSYTVPKGTHAMVFTRADEINNILKEVIK